MPFILPVLGASVWEDDISNLIFEFCVRYATTLKFPFPSRW